MALRSPALWMGNPAVQHTAQNDRLFRAGLLRPEVGSTAANRPLTAASGVIVGPPGTMGEVTLLSNTQFTVNPARWVLYSSASALGGIYEATNDAVETLGITAQNATQYRRSYLGVWVIDSFIAGSGDDLPHWGVVDGALAASAVAAALPSGGSLPANFLALGEFLIPPVGQAVTWTPYDVRTGMRGGILPVTATDSRGGGHIGQARDNPTNGWERWDGARWASPSPLGTWVNDVFDTGYSFTLTSPIGNPTGMGIRTVTVPPGRTLEVEMSGSQLALGASSSAYLQLFLGGVAQDAAAYATGTGTVSLPIQLGGAWTNTGNADASCQYSVTQLLQGGTATLRSTSVGVVRLRHRIV